MILRERVIDKLAIKKYGDRTYDFNIDNTNYKVECDGSVLRTKRLLKDVLIATSCFMYTGNKCIGYHIHYPSKKVCNYQNITKVPQKYFNEFLRQSLALDHFRKEFLEPTQYDGMR